MEEFTILETNFILLAQTKNRDLEYLLSALAKEENIQFESVESSENLKEQQPNNRIITFIIGSDVEDPIQSAQRFHSLSKRAKIVLFAKPENIDSLKETVKLSPFIGANVFCLDESEENLEVKVKQILQDSLKAEKYRSVVAEANSQLSSAASSQESAFNQNFISRLMDIAPIGIAIVSLEGNVLGWNKEAASIFNKSEAQILGTPLPQYFKPAESKKLKDYLRRSTEKRKTGSIDSLIIERKSPLSPARVLSFTAAPFTYPERAQKAFILTIKDITERKRAEEELQEINETLEERVKKRTASLLSYQNQLRSLASQLNKTEEKERHRLAAELHDNLGQMLAVNKMKVDLLLINQLPDELSSEIEEIKKGLDDAIIYARDLMSDLKPPPTLDKKDIRATIEWLAEKMNKHGLKVVIEDDGKPKKTTEEIQTTLLQSVRELLFNVIKHAKVNKAFVSMSCLDNQVQIIVEDKGKGIDIDVATSSPTDKGGFGLFNIKERMDLFGGSMEIDSEPGKGTKIKLLAPLKNGDSTTAPAESDAAEKSGQKIKVMLVDDHQMVRKGFKKVVDAEDDMVVVAEASDGKEALELARETSPDVIIMDIDMPHINGIDATKKIMSIMPDVHVVGLSSTDDNQEVIDSMRSAGATAYLSKSEAFETLSATIRSEARMEKGKE